MDILLTEESEQLKDAISHAYDPEYYQKTLNFLRQFDDLTTATKHDDGLDCCIYMLHLKIKMEGENK